MDWYWISIGTGALMMLSIFFYNEYKYTQSHKVLFSWEKMYDYGLAVGTIMGAGIILFFIGVFGLMS